MAFFLKTKTKKKKETETVLKTVIMVKREKSLDYPYDKKITKYSDGTFTVSKWR